MVERDRTAGDANQAPLHARRAARSLTSRGWGVSGKLWLAFGTLMLVTVVGGLVAYLFIDRIDRNLRQVVEVEEPLEQAVLEMEINAGEAALAVLEYVRDHEPRHLEAIRDAEADYERYAAEFKRLAETKEERQLGQEVASRYTEFKAQGDEIVALADQRRNAFGLFRDTVQEIDGLLDKNLWTAIDVAARDGSKKRQIALLMDRAIEEVVIAIAMYVAEPDASLRQEFLHGTTEFKEFVALYRESSLSVDEESLIRWIGESSVVLVRAGRNVMAFTDTLNTRLEELERSLSVIDAILDDRIQPLIPAETISAATDAKTSTDTAIKLLLIMGAIGLLVGSGSAWVLSRGIVTPLRALVQGTEIIGEGKLTHRIDIGSKGEFGDLATGFNLMVEKIQRAQRSVEKARASLEQRVEERTAELEETSENLIQARDHAEIANRTKSEFLANMSHELRTPLNAIIGFSEMIRSETFGPVGSPKYIEYVKDINESGVHLLALINDILDLSKIEAGKVELSEKTVDVAEAVGSCLTLVKVRAETADLNLKPEIANGLPALHADERMLKQILINLLSNAIKFTPAGGKVTVRAWSRPDAGYVFQVADTGIGIALQDIPAALATFKQVDNRLARQFEGAGLGLPLTKSLVELHGGSLDLQSEVGVGTTVTVRFPAERIVSEAATGT